jgi:hypothetical protein
VQAHDRDGLLCPQHRKFGRDVGFSTDFVCSAPESRRGTSSRFSSARDPQPTRALLLETEHWSLTTLREKLVKIGAKVVRHGRYVTFQLAEVAVPKELFRKILSLINDLRRRPAPA